MTRSSTLLRTAVTLLLAAILLPTLATAHERPLTPPETRFSLTALWNLLAPILPGATANAAGDNGWLIDPNGSPAPAEPGADNGWLIDPDG